MNMKQRVAEAVIKELEMRLSDITSLGVGSGTTVRTLLRLIPQKLLKDVFLVPTSLDTELALRSLGLSSNIREPGDVTINLTIDGADRVTPEGHAIKGGGGALTREKIVRYHSEEFWIMVDETKLVDDLIASGYPIPVEVLPFGFQATIQLLKKQFSASVTLRLLDEKKLGPVITDNGNYIVDVVIKTSFAENVTDFERKMKVIPGVIECGLFTHPPCDRLFVAKKGGNVEIWRPSQR